MVINVHVKIVNVHIKSSKRTKHYYRTGLDSHTLKCTLHSRLQEIVAFVGVCDFSIFDRLFFQNI